MRHSFLKTIIFLFALIVGLIFVDRQFFDQKINNSGATMAKRPASYLFSKLESTGFFFRGLAGLKNTITENENLKKENLGLLSRLADYEDLKNENDFLRSALDISPRFNNEIVYANIYQFQLGADGYDVLINEGTGGGITEGDIVVTEEGVLIGRIEEAQENFSRALVVSDTDFNVTAKVLDSETAGIARGALAQGLYFDLIIQSDPIKEGDVVVSSGTDLVPPALIVGTVSYVETNETDLFKKVKIKPAMGEIKIGRVLIIRKNGGS
ncbi:MAG TPA: rod shape-determining protein MreC [Candidatus Paceibacterota bacterium]|nr:rod shape-determining protein MreC [Candidatus Paceibacterota bacterium]